MNRSPSTSLWTRLPARAAAAVVLLGAAAPVAAQSVIYTTRTGGNIVACGPLTGGPLVHHTFGTPIATNDSIAVSDPGTATLPASAAAAQLDAIATSTTFSLSMAGTATRTAPAGTFITALADGRDVWEFTLAAPVRFTLTASLNASSTDATVPPQHFTFAGAIVPDPGAPPLPYQQTIQAPGSFTLAATGTLLPGQYFVSVFGRVESTSSPFTSSYSNSLTLTFQPAANATARQAFGNTNSYTCSLPVLGQTWNATVDVGLTGHSFAIVFASLLPGQVTLGPGFTVLLGGAPVEFLPIAPGPHATYAVVMPSDPTLAGFQLSTQALHFGVLPSLALSNAQDLTLGF
ncbi:MAG TPA: hypothetical protein VFZ65_05265 [Planctomycetota bacterium]|nr:hypothetical protein [Planctomycetota bacterium]